MSTKIILSTTYEENTISITILQKATLRLAERSVPACLKPQSNEEEFETQAI